MSFPPNNSPICPIWPIVRAFVVGFPLCLLLAFNYHNGWSASDWNTVIGVLAPMGVFDAIKHFVSGDGQQ